MSMVFFCSKTEVKKEVADPGYPDKEQVSDPGHTNKEQGSEPGHTNKEQFQDSRHTNKEKGQDPGHTGKEADTDPGHTGKEDSVPDYNDEEEGPDAGDTESVDESAFQVFLLLAHNTAY